MCVLTRKKHDEHEINRDYFLNLDNFKHVPKTFDEDFTVTNQELGDLMKQRGREIVETITEKYGSVDGLAEKLHVDVRTGLSGEKEDIKKRIEVFGKNEIPPKPPKLFIQLVLHALKETTLIILIGCAIISIALSFYHPPDDIVTEEKLQVDKEANLEWIEGVAIFVAVIVVVLVTAFNDWRKERQFRTLQDRIERENNASVVRNGEVVRIHVKDLVVGDVCCIKYGDLLPADGVVIHSDDLKIDESSLTGESDLIKKNENDVSLLAGTHVMEGSGNYLVTAVGLNSQTGIIFKLLGATKKEKKTSKADTKPDANGETGNMKNKKNKKLLCKKNKKKKSKKSVLQAKLGKLAMQIGYVGISAAVLTFIILCLRLSIDEFAVKKNEWSNGYIRYFFSFLTQAVTVIVVAVPEGLPLAVTLSLAFAVRQMTKDNNLVRHLDACETMGSATTICSDKTGTLTTNRMTVVQSYFGLDLIKHIPIKISFVDKFKQLLFESIAVNTNYTSKIEPPKQEGELPKQLGNKTECALLGFVTQLNGNYDEIRNEYPVESFTKCFTFNSARKMMSTIINKKPVNDGRYRLYTKGASEIVLEKCAFFLNSDGKLEVLDEAKRKRIIQKIVEPMASDGLRTICVAYRDFEREDKSCDINYPNVTYYKELPDWDNEKSIVSNLTCICITGIEDPVRDEVPDAIKKCQRSGVVVRMITGDNINTATSIAMKCGIIKPGDDFLILESKDFNARIRDANNHVSQELLDKVWPRLRVLARSTPEDKYTLVNGIVDSKLSANREVVAVTGDGTNDGPALKRADVGFAMGIQGTDVAKEASDIILTDDNFSSIVKAMMWGRNVYDSIAKFLQFQLTANLAAGLSSIICAAAIKAVPLKAVQMLWVNLVMDTLASLALGTEKPSESLLDRKPYGRKKPIISAAMLKYIIGHGIYQIAIVLLLVWFSDDWFLIDNVLQYDDINRLKAASQHFTIIFNAFVMMTLFNEINARMLHDEHNVFAGIHKNPYFYIIWIVCLAGQILIINFGGVAFNVVPLDIDHWMWCLVFGVGSLLWGQLISTIPSSFVKRLLCKRSKAKIPESINNPKMNGVAIPIEKTPGSKIVTDNGICKSYDNTGANIETDDEIEITWF